MASMCLLQLPSLSSAHIDASPKCQGTSDSALVARYSATDRGPCVECRTCY